MYYLVLSNGSQGHNHYAIRRVLRVCERTVFAFRLVLQRRNYDFTVCNVIRSIFLQRRTRHGVHII